MKRILFCLVLAAATLAAGPITFSVDINTSSLAGTTGYVDLTYNKGNTPALDGVATITGFSGASMVGTPSVMGSVSGTLPGTTAIGNTGAPANDYFQSITFGSLLHLFVTFSGPSVNASASVGSTFALSLYANATGTPLITSDGTIVTFDVNGAVRPTTYATQARVGTVPEPATLGAAALGLALLASRGLRRRGV